MSYTVDLLAAGRANGIKRDLRGIRGFRATYEILPGTPKRGTGRIVAVTTIGRELSANERARLLDFAALQAGP